MPIYNFMCRQHPGVKINATVVAIAIALFTVGMAKGDFLQSDCWGIRTFFVIDLFLSAQNDQAALDKMSKAGQIKILGLASEVTIVAADSVHGMYQVRPAGKTETFYVPAHIVGRICPRGREAELAQKDQLVNDSSTRIKEFIGDSDNTSGAATLAGTIQRNSQDVALALDHLKRVGIDFSDDLKKIEAAYKIIKNADYYRASEVADAERDVAESKVKLLSAVLKAEQDLLKANNVMESSPATAAMSTTPRGTKQTFERLEDRPDYTQTDTLLNAIYKKVRSGLSSSQKIKLRDDEREWLVKRENLKSDPDAFVAFTKERIQTLKTCDAE
jgi:uncharacterized protein YecT (DUF1311 family)